MIYKKPKTLSLKNPRNFWNVYPQPQKTSNSKAETKDPRILRSQFTTLFSFSYIFHNLTLGVSVVRKINKPKFLTQFATWWSICAQNKLFFLISIVLMEFVKPTVKLWLVFVEIITDQLIVPFLYQVIYTSELHSYKILNFFC